jgi:heat shock protein HslJ
MKKILTLTAAILAATMLTACGSSSIVGRWESDKRVSELEFFSDGTYTSSDANHTGTYSIDGKRLRLSGLLASDWVCDFDISGDQMTLSGDLDGEYSRAK